MNEDAKTVWNRKYAEAPEKWLEPDPFLILAYERFLSKVPAGIALDVAGGAGRQAIWLASRGWRVTIVDISDVGLQLARDNASRVLGPERANQLLTLQRTDLKHTTDLGREKYDLVIVFRYLNRELFPALVRALKPGGTLIYSHYTVAQLKFEKGPHDERFLLQPDELRHAFADLQVLHYQEKTTDKATAELGARKLESG